MIGRRRSTLARVGLGLALVIGASACTATAVRPPAPRIVDLARDAGEGIAAVDPDRGVVVPADQLRLLLEELLGVHGTLTVEMMREAVSGQSSLQAWINGLTGNTAELSGAIGLVYGPDGARAFEQLWSFHTQFFLTYADAVRVGDRTVATEALEGLEDYQADFASFIATATGGAAPEAAVAELIAVHVGHMIDQLDAFHRGDMAESLALQDEGHAYLATIGTTLAGAIAAQDPSAFPGEPDTEAAVYCSIVGSEVTSLADSIIASAARRGARVGAVPPESAAALADHQRAALADVAVALDIDLGSITDLTRVDEVDAFREALLGAVTDPSMEVQTAIEHLAGLGLRLETGGDPAAIPAAVRDAYATAYRLAHSTRPG